MVELKQFLLMQLNDFFFFFTWWKCGGFLEVRMDDISLAFPYRRIESHNSWVPLNGNDGLMKNQRIFPLVGVGFT